MTICVSSAELSILDSGISTECSAGECRVKASLVCSAWRRVEAANPAQHTHLSLSFQPYAWISAEEQESMTVKTADIPLYLQNTSRMRWEFRSTSRLCSLYVSGYNVPLFLAMKPTLTSLEILTLERFGYSHEHAQQLLYLTSLKTLQVQYFPACLKSVLIIVCSHCSDSARQGKLLIAAYG